MIWFIVKKDLVQHINERLKVSSKAHIDFTFNQFYGALADFDDVSPACRHENDDDPIIFFEDIWGENIRSKTERGDDCTIFGMGINSYSHNIELAIYIDGQEYDDHDYHLILCYKMLDFYPYFDEQQLCEIYEYLLTNL